MRKEILYAFIFCYSSIAFSQKAKVSGSVYDSKGLAVAYAIVHEKNTSNATIADENGKYVLSLDFGPRTIVYSNVGYLKQEVNINVNQDNVKIQRIMLEPDPETSLTETTIIAKSNVRMVEETGFNVVAIDAKPFHNAAINLTEVLDQTPGVKINQEGGLGSKSNVTINGLSGRHVRFFIDGMPMDAMSSAFQLNNLPVNMAERIEVYKGVVPINFGSDALGGAVNIVTKKNAGTYLDASYSYGSFNTHMTFINAGHTSDNGFTIQLNAFQNYSDNNYYMDDIKVLDFETSIYSNPQRVQRFHDTYHNEAAIVKLGLINKRFADQLLFGFTYGQEYQEVQNPAYIYPVYGDKYYTSSTIMPSVLYTKEDIFIDNLNVNFATNYNFGEGHNVDTTYWQYNWLGERRPSESKGEVTPASDYTYHDNNGTINANVEYEFRPGHRFTINNVSNYFSREGHNILDADDEMNKYPRVNNRNILGIGLNNDFSEKLKTSIFTKRYSYYSSAYINQVVGGVENYQMVSKDDSRWGLGFTTTYFIGDLLQLKANYENTYRMPTSQELFGQVFLEPQQNLSLLPETSNNFNFGIHFNKQLKKHSFLSTDVNFFYRHTEDFIKRTVDMKKGGESFENILLVKTPGIDAEIRYSYGDRFTCGGNLSYQKPMSYDKEKTYYKKIVPNQPNFFGNADAGYFFNDLLMLDSRLSIRYNLQFIHEFANDWYEAAKRISTQWSHNVGVVYSWKQGRYNLSFDCKNLTDAKLYDNFSLQKPGRSFSAKFRYFINKKS